MFHEIVMVISCVVIIFCIYIIICLNRVSNRDKPQTLSKGLPMSMRKENKREWCSYWHYILTGRVRY